MAEARYHLIRDFVFQDGTVLPSVSVAYRDSDPSGTRTKTALVVTHFRGRLPTVCTFSSGPLTALREHRVITVALFGNGESAGPSNTPGFPQATAEYRDCVRAQHDLLVALGVAELDVVIGFSMGGQTAYHWALMHPQMVRHIVVICSSARTSRHNHQFLEGPRAALENAADYVPMTQRQVDTPPCRRGLHAFGKAYSAWLASADWFDQELYRALGFDSLAAWDHVFTGANYDGWDPDDLLTQLGIWQRGDVTVLADPVDGRPPSLQDTLARIQTPVLLLPSRSDQYFRWEAAERESRWLPRATLQVIPSVWGHMAGIGANPVDAQFIDQQIMAFLAEK
ncbi:homoserine O-acetyltransferase [Grosmannia clavigera kw1407]|uniref:Homoserine O-acetyltransferase n=1 Tax=Grosmannia clavigera (strain kw1407 / UAMH 11150) TaxID=655863 RepID=F0XMT5_GROCL|nr:homoserine O-acetyltransferase [Grosmannia clavigera kw1407]EFX01193.1 homoserine O-acetyltransferase [Grosmannia clavigera kw1407]